MEAKIAVLGASFNPVHLGHLHLLKEMDQRFHFDTIFLIPRGISQFKGGFPLLWPYRILLLREAIRTGLPKALAEKTHILSTEVDQVGLVSYSSATMAFLEELCAARDRVLGFKTELEGQLGPVNEARQKIAFLAGDDLLFEFRQWHDFPRLADLVSFKVGVREETGQRAIADQKQGVAQAAKDRQEALPSPCAMDRKEAQPRSYAMDRQEALRVLKEACPGIDLELVNHPPLPLSSTEIRKDPSQSHIEATMPPGAAATWKKLHLSQVLALPQDFEPEELAGMEHDISLLASFLGEKRLIHLCTCMIFAIDLAKHYGIDYRRVYRPALFHDLAKELPLDLQVWMAQQYDPGLTATFDENIMHGLASASYLREYLGWEDEEALNAVAYHSTLRPDPSDVEKIVFLADKLEWGRTYRHLSKLRRAAQVSLDLGVYETLKELEHSKIPLHPLSQKLLGDLEGSLAPKTPGLPKKGEEQRKEKRKKE